MGAGNTLFVCHTTAPTPNKIMINSTHRTIIRYRSAIRWHSSAFSFCPAHFIQGKSYTRIKMSIICQVIPILSLHPFFMEITIFTSVYAYTANIILFCASNILLSVLENGTIKISSLWNKSRYSQTTGISGFAYRLLSELQLNCAFTINDS